MTRIWAASWLVAALGVILAGCGGGAGGSGEPPAPPTLSDLTIYLAQLRCPDGRLPMTCADPVPQKASDLMSWRRWDGQDQYEDSVVSDDGSYWITTWTYATQSAGGEVYVSDGTTVSIVATQDEGKPGVLQRFTNWGLYNNTTPLCGDGWGAVGSRGRACRATVTYPASGGGLAEIVAETIISEHYSKPGYAGNMERFHMAKGWGRLCWEAYNDTAPRGGMPSTCGTGAPAVEREAVDRRRITNLIAMTPPLRSVADFGWPGPGFVP